MWGFPIFLAAAAFGLDFFVETDQEKICKVIYTAAKAVEEENPAAIEAVIANSYSDSYHKTKKHLLYHCNARLSEPIVEKNIARIVSIEQVNPKAAVIFTVRILFDKRSYVRQLYKQEIFVKAKADVAKQQDGGWLIDRAEILELDRVAATWGDIEQ